MLNNKKLKEMKNGKLITIFCLLFAAGMITMSSCKKNNTATADSDTSGATDNATAENTSNDIVAIGAQASENGSLSSYRDAGSDFVLSTCATVTRDTNAKTVLVTFNGGTCLDGRSRSGSLLFDYHLSPAGDNFYRDPGFTFTVTSNNYVVDGNQVNIISKTVTNTTNGGNHVGWNPATTNETWAIAANIKITKPNGDVITWNCTRTKTLLNTASVYTAADLSNYPASDVTPINWPMAKIQIDGSASGTRANGETFTAVATAMVRDFGGCTIQGRHPWISGTLLYSPAGKYARLIDFGNGSCDLNATVTINGNTYNIVLP